MKKNDIIHMTITDCGVQGEGIGRFDGMPFFVPGAAIGDTITAGITKLKKTYGYARLIEVEQPSADRVEPPCPVASICGGCTLMHLSYERQLSWKASVVENALLRIGGVPQEVVSKAKQAIIGMDKPLHYRNKSQYPVGRDRNGSIVIGFYAARSHRIVPIWGGSLSAEKKENGCLIAHPRDAEILPVVLKYMQENHVLPFDETTGEGLLRHILIRHAFSRQESMVCLVVNGNSLPNTQKLCDRLSKIQGVVSVVLNENRRRDNVILGEKTRVLWGAQRIEDVLLGNHFSISARSFYQVNPVQTERIYRKAVEYAALTGSEIVWDLYCGIGTISLCMAAGARQVAGVEIVHDAVVDAKENAEKIGIKNASFFEGSAGEVAARFEKTDLATPDVVVVDPPRKGLDEETIRLILSASPARLVYVSCNPSTLARDIKEFRQGGFELVAYTPFDAFCFSGHVETVVLMSRRNRRTGIVPWDTAFGGSQARRIYTAL